MLYKDKDWLTKHAHLSTTEVAKEFNVDRGTIRYWEKKHGIRLTRKTPRERVNHFDQSYFEQIDTQEKAYFLGFIMADAYISSNNRALEIKVKATDLDILEKFNTSLNSIAKIGDRRNGTRKYKIISICSKKLVEDLACYGVIRKKSNTIPFPRLQSNDLYRHFLRGFFDGDGHIGHRQCALIVGSMLFKQGFILYLREKFNFEPWYKEKDNYYHFQFSRKDKWFIQWLYQDASIYLDRKYQSFTENWACRK
jgi:intein/homing endonuclease